MTIFFTLCGVIAVGAGGLCSVWQYQAFIKTLNGKGEIADLAYDGAVFLACCAVIISGLRSLAAVWF